MHSNLIKRLGMMLRARRRFVCPFCNTVLRDLAHIGLDIPVLKEKHVIGGGVRKGGCQHCGSTDRERLVYAYLSDEYRLFDRDPGNFIILHIAPEKNLSKLLYTKNFRQYICGDVFANGYHYPGHVMKINVLNIPYPENAFDLIICNHVLEHVTDDAAAIKELYRVLKPGGQAILQVPISANSAATYEDFSITGMREREIAFGQSDHVRIYGQDYVTRLENSWFRVKRINISLKYARYGLNREEDLFICEK